MTVMGDTDHTGTTVTFKPDPEMFEDTVYDYETLHTRMREQAFLNAGLHISIADERGAARNRRGRHVLRGRHPGVCGPTSTSNKTPLHEDVIYMSGEKEDSMAEVAMQYNDSYNEIILSFANNIHTPEGGMHEEGFKRALTNAAERLWPEGRRLLKDDDKSLRRRLPGGSDLRHLRQADGSPVRGADQGQAGQQ